MTERSLCNHDGVNEELLPDALQRSSAGSVEWAPCDACPSPKFCRHHKVVGCQGSWNPVLKQYPLHYHEGWHDGFEAALTECPRPVLPDHSAKACVESGNCGCDAQSTAPAQSAQVANAMIDAAAREMWNDRDARMGGPWDGRSPDEVCVIQTKATARAALVAALTAQPPAAPVEPEAVEDKKCVPTEQYEALERLHHNELLRCQAAEREIERLSRSSAVTEAMIDAAVAAIDEFPFSNGPADDRAPMRAALEAALTSTEPQPLSVPWTGNLSMDLRKTPVHVRAEGVPLIDEAGVCWAVVFPDKSGFYDHGSAIVSALSRPNREPGK